MLPYDETYMQEGELNLQDLAEGYKHEYKTFWILTDGNGKYIQKVKSKEHGEQLKQNCRCPHWKVQHYTENEEVLQKRKQVNSFQHSNTHKVLTFTKRDKERELEYSRKEQSRMDRILRKQDRAKEKKRIQLRIENNESIYGLDQGILQELKVEAMEKEIAEMLMG